MYKVLVMFLYGSNIFYKVLIRSEKGLKTYFWPSNFSKKIYLKLSERKGIIIYNQLKPFRFPGFGPGVSV